MKNKLILPFFITIFSTVLTACPQETPVTFSLEEEFYQTTQVFIDLNDYQTIADYEEGAKSFGVYIYVGGCLSCQSFEPLVIDVLQEYAMTLYRINIQVVQESENTVKSTIQYAPSVILFEKGQVRAFLDATASTDTEYFQSAKGFDTWLTTYVSTTYMPETII